MAAQLDAQAHPPNRLADQTSPYLLQHARNPVQWWPWGPEAFAEARRRDVPIFLSIGYSTCYWCHVMERESFEHEAIAAQMNDGFVCIKVDREERPDVDDIYMAAVQAFSGRGGWPMSVFLEPGKLRPFWAGTYFPAEPRFAGMPTFPQVLDGMKAAWTDQRAEVMEQSESLADAVRERLAASERPVRIGDEQVAAAVSVLLRSFDRNHGGFGGAGQGPKFPQPVNIEFLLEARRVAADEPTRQAIDAAVRTTLDKMACGGMFDQVGGGFHRYSVDATWTVPHFEKMLYDNAQLAEVYARAAVTYDDPFYRRTAIRTLDYILREMTDPDTGRFFSAQDAEVNHREGQNYLWTPAQLEEVLPPEDAAWVARVYGVARGPNFRDPHSHAGEPASSVLRLDDRPDRIAAAMGTTEVEFLSRLDRINETLLKARAKRDQPGLDDKSLASWNGLTISAMAVAGAALGENRFVAAASRAADFVLKTMRSPPGDDGSRDLLRAYRAGAATIPAFLEDYAFVIRGLIELHRTGIDPEGRFLAAATTLASDASRHFGESEGGFFDTRADQPDLFVRARTVFDGAIPSGAGAMLLNLLDLGQITGESAHVTRAVRGIVAVSAGIARAPLGAISAVRALLRSLAANRAELDDAMAAIDATAPTPAEPDLADGVEILAATDRVEVPEGKPAGLTLRVRIPDSLHLTAADPGPTEKTVGLAPFRVFIVGGSGVQVFADYPAGTRLGKDDPLLVYRGELQFAILLEREGAWSGRPLIAVRYQPCTEDACLAPRTVELDVAIDPK